MRERGQQDRGKEGAKGGATWGRSRLRLVLGALGCRPLSWWQGARAAPGGVNAQVPLALSHGGPRVVCEEGHRPSQSEAGGTRPSVGSDRRLQSRPPQLVAVMLSPGGQSSYAPTLGSPPRHLPVSHPRTRRVMAPGSVSCLPQHVSPSFPAPHDGALT